MVTEAVARLEAKLRGGTWEYHRAVSLNGDAKHCVRHRDEYGNWAYQQALKYDAPRGAWWFVEQLKLKVQPEPGGGYFAHTLDYDPYNVHGEQGAAGLGPDPVSAVAAAVEALAAIEALAASARGGNDDAAADSGGA